jgi:lipoprotein-releasing system permease protein
MDYEREVTSMEVKLKNYTAGNQCQEKIESILGNRYQVQNKYQQEELLFKTMKSEKLIIFFILAFIMVVATFNIIGTLGMLIVEKKSDITVLNSLGAKSSLIGKIFIFEGMFISFLGGVAGMLLGSFICFIQQTFHIVRIGSGEGNFILNYYPVSMEAIDFIIVFITILLISLLASWIPTKIIKKKLLKNIIN